MMIFAYLMATPQSAVVCVCVCRLSRFALHAAAADTRDFEEYQVKDFSRTRINEHKEDLIVNRLKQRQQQQQRVCVCVCIYVN
jgi:hypothetical protein